MRGIIAIVALVLAAASPAVAQTYVPSTSHERAVVELLELTRTKETTAAATEMMVENMVSQNPVLAQFRDVFVDFFKEYSKWEELLPEYVRIYREAFSEAELRELIAFYKTPVGRKSIELMPRLMQEGAALGQKQIQPHLPELERRIQARVMGGGME
jgi:hypothetical protein